MAERYKSRQDPNNFKQDGGKGIDLISFANRHTINQIQYASCISPLLQQTFSLLDSQGFRNQEYCEFHFLEKFQVESCLHSESSEGYTCVLKQKHNRHRRDKLQNTSFLVNCNLNRQLDRYMSHKSDKKHMDNNFSFYSCFIWDLLDIPYLTPLLKSQNKSFALKRRYTSQGLGKTFTVYFRP